ncbi:MAG: helix-turn-helix domain-containing protein [Patescibacteria group bacterium]
MTIKSTQLEPTAILRNLGLSTRETQVYLVLLKNGPMLPLNIARQTGLKRTSLYALFPEMLEKGLIREVTQGKRRLFQAVSPESLLSEYQRKYQAVKEGLVKF